MSFVVGWLVLGLCGVLVDVWPPTPKRLAELGAEELRGAIIVTLAGPLGLVLTVAVRLMWRDKDV